jgi:DNA-binding response OmpR family regulator
MPDGRPIQILVLEDEPVLRALLGMILSREGFKVLLAGSRKEGETIVEIMGWAWMDLIVADINLHKDPAVMDGYLFHALWRGRHSVPPFIFTHTHDYTQSFPDDCEGRVFHLMKPFSPSSLFALIGSILDGR